MFSGTLLTRQNKVRFYVLLPPIVLKGLYTRFFLLLALFILPLFAIAPSVLDVFGDVAPCITYRRTYQKPRKEEERGFTPLSSLARERFVPFFIRLGLHSNFYTLFLLRKISRVFFISYYILLTISIQEYSKLSSIWLNRLISAF